jgi:hypothetical protein
MSTKMRISARHGIRAIHDDHVDLNRMLGRRPVPRRASHVEPIQEGPNAGLWYVDMSPLGESYRYCLWPAFGSRQAALEEEHNHIVQHWIQAKG